MHAALHVPTTALRTFVDDLIAADILADLDLLYVMAARTEAESRINLVAPGTFPLVSFNNASFTASQGWIGDGSSAYLEPGFSPTTHGVNFTLNDASLWAWSLTNVAQNGTAEIGEVSGSDRSYIAPRDAGDNFTARINDAATLTIASVTDSTGLWGIQRTGATAREAWRNGVSIGSDTQVSTNLSGNALRICGATSTNFGNRRIAIAAVGASLSGKEADFHTACETYLTAVGAI